MSARSVSKKNQKLQLNDDKIIFNNPIFRAATFQCIALSPVSFSAKLHNACGHDMKRHVTGVYKDSRRRTQEIKLQTIYGPICAPKKHHRKHLCERYRFL